MFTEEDKIVLGNVTEIGITSLHSSNDDTEESLPCVLNLRVPNIPMKTSLVQLVERRLLLMLTAFYPLSYSIQSRPFQWVALHTHFEIWAVVLAVWAAADLLRNYSK